MVALAAGDYYDRRISQHVRARQRPRDLLVHWPCPGHHQARHGVYARAHGSGLASFIEDAAADARMTPIGHTCR